MRVQSTQKPFFPIYVLKSAETKPEQYCVGKHSDFFCFLFVKFYQQSDG